MVVEGVEIIEAGGQNIEVGTNVMGSGEVTRMGELVGFDTNEWFCEYV